jgi:hypothetical protein
MPVTGPVLDWCDGSGDRLPPPADATPDYDAIRWLGTGIIVVLLASEGGG